MKDSPHIFPSSSAGGQLPVDLANYTNDLTEGADGVWRGRGQETISYPTAGNAECFEVEDNSFWFAHRNECLQAVLRKFPTTGPFFDIGGGNGFVAAAIQSKCGLPVVLVEPGADGTQHAQARKIGTIVHATLNEAHFHDHSLPAVGLFDVLEHICEEQDFLREIKRCLAPHGRFYLTVPASFWLWSDADVQAGHFRRYTITSLRRALLRGGFRPLFISRFFSPLPLPLFLCRSLPSLFGRRRMPSQNYSRQHRAGEQSWLKAVWRWEINRLALGSGICSGTSCLAVAEPNEGLQS